MDYYSGRTTHMKNPESKYLNKLIEHFSLTLEESEALMQIFLSGDFNPRLAASILSIISFKGEHVEELAGFAKTLIEQMKKFNSSYDDLIDIVGTGGDNKNAFNISTISCLILSVLKVRVAKQIRHSTSSGCGSADLLKAVGINLNASYEQKKQCLDQENFVFTNNQDYYTVLEPIKNIEKELGFPTILSMLPPLCHPARIKRIIIGAPDRIRASLIARSLEIIGIDKAYVLWNEAGYDEIVPIGLTRVLVIENGKELRELSLTANDFALAGNYKVGTLIKGGTLALNLQMLEEINSCTPGIAFDTVAMNVSLGLRLSGVTKSLKEGSELLKHSFKNGDLKQKIANIAKITLS